MNFVDVTIIGFTLAAAVGVFAFRRVIHAAFALFALLFGVAAAFASTGADFLAVSQVIVYVGGILVVLLFGVMLTVKYSPGGTKGGLDYLRMGLGSLAVGAGGFSAWWMLAGIPVLPETDIAPQTQPIGVAFLTDHLLVFELVSVVLLVALVGAAYYAREASPKGRDLLAARQAQAAASAQTQPHEA